MRRTVGLVRVNSGKGAGWYSMYRPSQIISRRRRAKSRPLFMIATIPSLPTAANSAHMPVLSRWHITPLLKRTCPMPHRSSSQRVASGSKSGLRIVPCAQSSSGSPARKSMRSKKWLAECSIPPTL